MSGKDAILDGIMNQVGEFGPYQFRQHLLHLLTSFLAGVHMLSFTFTNATPEHRCYIPEVDEISMRDVEDVDIAVFIPKDKFGKWESCEKFDGLLNNENETEGCGGHYYFDLTYYPTSRVIDFGMVCEKRWMKAVLQSLYMFGVLWGALFCGMISDKFGRKPALCFSAVMQLVFGVACAFINNYYLYGIALMLYGAFGSGGAYVTGFVLTMELVGASKRTVCGTMFSISFAIGIMLDAFWAWLIPNAQLQQIIFAAHSILLLGHWWLADESIPWLWGKGRKKEAIEIVLKCVKMNENYYKNKKREKKCEIATIKIANEEIIEKDFKKDADIEIQSKDMRMDSFSSFGTTGDFHLSDENGNKTGLVELLRLPNLRTRILIMSYAWFANSLVYFGLTFNSTLPGNPFLMTFLNGLAEVPGYMMNILLLDKTGRRSLEFVCCLIGGIGCIVVTFIPHDTFVIILAMLAKVAIASSFAIVYNYTAELFPTVVRNSVVGITTMAARGSAMLAPQIVLLDALWSYLPFMIFGGTAVISAFLSLALPETLNKEMPQTVEEGEAFGVGDTGFQTIWKWLKRRRLSYASRNRLR